VRSPDLLVAVVAGELRRAAPFRDPVEHQNPKPTGRAGHRAQAYEMVRRRFFSSWCRRGRVTPKLATGCLGLLSRLGNGRLVAEVRSGDGCGLLTHVELVEVGG